ncbi:hypothetical protein [Mesorhizobium sp. 8]|uniref:hypothetical protein n=1 Tax=Mesorhizobium sp. 8 TaxID=2584466 RepID=UPI0015D66E65|nr:hypothetical protein [Mesorhizobium sp. 8]
MLAALIRWITGDLVGQLTAAYKDKLAADTDEKKLVADAVVKQLEAAVQARATSAQVVTTGMQHKAFWIPWLIAAVPTAAWFGWGMCDSLFHGALPDVAALPPQLKEYADIVFQNIFYVGGGVAGLQLVASAIRGRK